MNQRFTTTAFKALFSTTIIALVFSACATTRRTDLFFGMNIPGGGHVSTEQWKNFSDSMITPRFPEGYTESDAWGKWRDTATLQTIAEHTRVLTFIGKKSRSRNALLDTVIQAYIRQYHQQ